MKHRGFVPRDATFVPTPNRNPATLQHFKAHSRSSKYVETSIRSWVVLAPRNRVLWTRADEPVRARTAHQSGESQPAAAI